MNTQYSAVANVDFALISVSDNCAVGCQFCFRADRGKANLTRKRLARILSRLHELGVRQVCFTGGEPTDQPEFVEFCRIALQFGIYPSVVTSARSEIQIQRLEAASRFLSHVTLSVDSAVVRSKFGSYRTISAAGKVLSRLSGLDKSLHVVVTNIQKSDIDDLLGVLCNTETLLELSPLLPSMPSSANEHNEHYTETLKQFQRDLQLLRQYVSLSTNIDLLSSLSPKSCSLGKCSKRRLYISASGQIRFCPYHKDDQVSVDVSRPELMAQLYSLQHSSIPKSLLCWLVCKDE